MANSQDGTTPLVSILTPSFNQGRFLDDCIDSVARQSYARVEQVICDGGSEDETIDVLKSAPNSVRWLSEPDSGQAHALNKALALSKGEIIGWLNSDDAYFDPRAIETAVGVFQRRPEIAVVYGHAALVNASGLVLHLMWAPSFSYRLLRRFNFIIQPTAFVRRSVLDGFLVDESFEYSMDRELWLRLGKQGKFARLDRIVAIDRHHPARKVYDGTPHMQQENDELDRMYANLGATQLEIFRRAFKVVGRLAGVRLVGETRGPNACRAHIDGVGRVTMRQVAVRRRYMPTGVEDS